MEILCSLKNINLSFGDKSLFKNAELIIHFGERIGLIGLNGTGKSSLFKILSEQINPDVSVPPFEFSKASGKVNADKKYSAFYVPQDIILNKNDNVSIKNYVYRFYPKLEVIHHELEKLNTELESSNDPKKIEQQKKLLDEFEHLGGWRISQSYESYLKVFNLGDLNRMVRELSGGEQKKILLSLGLSSEAHLVLWDEPTNHIDTDTIHIFEEELMDAKNAFLLVTHDRSLLTRVTDKIFHLKNGRIDQFDGSYTEYLEFLKEKDLEREKLVTRLKNTLRREDAWMKQGIKARGTRNKKRVDNFHDLKSKISKLKSEAKKVVDFNVSHSRRQTKELINFKEVDFSYETKNIFNNLNFTIRKKEKIGLVGPNGIGKTTLVKLIDDTLMPTNGNRKSAPELIIKHFTQKREELDPDMTPFELLGEGVDHVILPNGHKQHVITYFESFLFKSGDIHRPISSFSGGEKNRLQLAYNLKQAGDLLIFDEPTNDLDLETLEILEKKLMDHDGALILISHDRSFLSNVTNSTWLIKDNSIETFSAGYSQVEDYLETLRIEKELLLKDEKPKEKEKISAPPKSEKRKLTNKEKERLKTIDKDIEEKENHIFTLEEQIAAFDFSNMDQDTSMKLANLNEEKDLAEMKLLELYEELESLKI